MKKTVKKFSVKYVHSGIAEVLITLAKQAGLEVCKHFASNPTQSRWPYFVVHGDGTEVIGSSSSAHSPVVSIEEAINILQGVVDVKLNDDYTATIDRVNKVVRVGCQVIAFDRIEDLWNAIH